MLRKIAAAVFAAGIAAAPAAVKASSPLEEVTAVCTQVSDLARTIMTQRQASMPMAAMIAAVQTDNPNHEGMVGVALMMVRQAYAEPAWNSPERQRRAADEFANAMFSACFDFHYTG